MWAMRLMCVPVAWIGRRPSSAQRSPLSQAQRSRGERRAFGSPQVVENGGEFFGEREQAAVGGRLLIAQAIDKRRGRETRGGDAFGDPVAVGFSEETADLVPAGPLAGLAGFADQHDEKVEAMAGGIDHAVGAGTSVAEDDEKLEENGSGMGLGVRRQKVRPTPATP